MDKVTSRMLDLLKEMRDEDNVYAIKAEFEAEGSRMDELVMLNEVIFRANMKLIIKIGGCEAVSDIDRCKTLGAGGIMAPMIETPFAMQKFVKAGKKIYGNRASEVEWIINAETKTCHENLEEILEVGKGFVSVVTVGRDDLSSSMNIPKSELNGAAMAEATSDILKKSRAAGYVANFGGGISTFEALPFIHQMSPYADRVETRKVIMNMDSDERRMKKSIMDAIEFEALYLQHKCNYYNAMANEDAARLKMMQERLEAARAVM